MTTVGTIVGRYELLRLLATGGMGEVYLARLRSAVEGFGALSAIKILPRGLSSNHTLVKMFLDEARAVGKLHHKNIVQVRDVGEHEGQYYIVMEYISGQNLRELLGDASIRDRPLFEPKLGTELFADIASALGAAHAENIIHRDVSPNNIMISDEGIAKLIDFGVARAFGSSSSTNPGTLKGKFGYMAPEYVREQGYDHRADVFSLGVVMWETFARRRLFKGTTAAEQLHQLIDGNIPPLGEVVPSFPRDLELVVAGALERDPARRIGSALMLADALAELGRSLPAGPDVTLRKWLERRVPSRVEERRRVDNSLLSIPPGAAIPDFGVAYPDAGSLPGTYGFDGSIARRSQVLTVPDLPSSQMPAIAPLPSARGSAQLAEPPPHEPAPIAAAPRSSRTRAIILVSSLAVVALVVFLVARGSGGSSGSVQEVAIASGDMRGSGSGSSAAGPTLAGAHREIGLKAMTDGDYARAVSEFKEAIAAGGGGDLEQLADMAAKLLQDAAAKPTAVAPVLAPTPTPPVPPVTTSPPRPIATRVSVPTRPSRPPAKAVETSGREEASPKPDPSPPPAPPPPRDSYLAVTSDEVAPPNTVIVVDGAVAGRMPGLVKVTPGDHQLVIRTGDRVLYTSNVGVAAGETRRLSIAALAKPRVEAPPPVHTPPAPPARPASKPTPRVGTDGDVATGARVVGACNGCHAKTGAGGIAPRSKSRAMWERFFASGAHDHYMQIGDQMSAGQLMAARAYLRANAADSAENQGAGVKE